MEKTVSQAIEYRRSVRIFKDINLDNEKVKNCLINASLAPNSSNLQLWEFIHVVDKELIKKLSPACMNQNAAKTANQLVVFVTRKDLWKQRAKANLSFMDSNFGKNTSKKEQSSREKVARNYYGKIIPFAYADFLGIFGFFKSDKTLEPRLTTIMQMFKDVASFLVFFLIAILMFGVTLEGLRHPPSLLYEGYTRAPYKGYT